MMTVAFLVLLTAPFRQSADGPDSCVGKIVRDSLYRVLVDPSASPFRLHFVAREECCYQLFIMAGDSPDTFQIIEDYSACDLSFDDEETEKALEIIDVNFDGYPDLKVIDIRGNTTNTSYKFWVYNREKKVFEYNESLTHLLGCNPSFDPERKTVHTGGVSGCIGMCYSWETYQFINSTPILIEREQQDVRSSGDARNEQFIFVRTLERLVGGKLAIIRKVKGSLEEVDKQWNEN